jgi:hypothetical protein
MSDETKSVVIKGVTVMKGDVVRIKFRKLEQILQDKKQWCRNVEVLEHYKIDDHMATFLQGIGHFKISGINGKNEYLKLSNSGTLREKKRAGRSSKVSKEDEDERLEEISIIDHNLSNDYDHWLLNETLIEEISVENHISDSYYSENHQLSLVVVDSVLFINGVPVTNTDSKIFEMFERVLSDAAIKKLLEVDFEDAKVEQEDDDNF